MNDKFRTSTGGNVSFTTATTASTGTLWVDGTGTTAASGQGIVIGRHPRLEHDDTPKTDEALRKQNAELKAEIEYEAYKREELQSQINMLQREVNDAERLTESLRAQLRQAEQQQVTMSASSFTQKELKVMLNKLHPDKNKGSEICTQITQKIIKAKGR
jgi:predicted RNase H-like nuclease (RuvC/YqgF family)